MLDEIAVRQGDDCDAVGDVKGTTRKTGDVVVAIEGCTGPARGRIVFEAKASRLSKPKAVEELDRARTERNADYAVLVVPDEERIPARMNELREYGGDKLVVCFDPEDGSTLGLEVAYKLARARVLMARGEADGVDAAAIREAIERAGGAMGDVLRVKQQLTGAKTSINKGAEILDAMAVAVRAQLLQVELLLAASEPDDEDVVTAGAERAGRGGVLPRRTRRSRSSRSRRAVGARRRSPARSSSGSRRRGPRLARRRAASPTSRCAGPRRCRSAPASGISSAADAAVIANAETISNADASPSAIRGGIVIGAQKGMNDVTWASVPSGLSSTGEGEEERDQDQHRQRRHRGLQLLLARHERARAGEQAGVERVAEHEPPDRERGGEQDVGVDVERPRRGRRHQARPRDDEHLAEPEHAEPDDLARQQVLRPDRRQQHLHDARGLLLHDPAREQVAEGQQLGVEREHGDERERPLAIGLGVDRLHRRDLQRGRVERLLDLRVAQPRALERLALRHLALGGLEDPHQRLVGLLLRVQPVLRQHDVDLPVLQRRVRVLSGQSGGP